MQDIPYDIWHYITSFLPSHEIKNLYSVNRPLHSIALDERYRKISIGPFSSSTTKRSIERATDPEISSRVRSLVFRPGYLCKVLYESAIVPSTTSEDPVSELADAFGNMKILPQQSEEFYNSDQHNALPLPAHWTQRNMLRIMNQLTFLTSLQVKIRGEEHWYFQKLAMVSSFFSAGWAAYGNTLKSLELIVPLEDIQKILPPLGSLPLGRLENLSLLISRASISTNTSAAILEIILPLINKHHSTLRTLNLDVMDRADLSSFFQAIEHIKCLESFTLKQPFEGRDLTDLSGLKNFFQRHGSHLTHVSMNIMPSFTHYTTPYSFFSQDCFSVTFPKLQQFSINFRDFPEEYSEALITYLLKLKPTLVSLDVSEHRWSLGRLNTLLEGFSDSLLRDLKISLSVFDPSTLHTLAVHLSRLDSLSIDFVTFGPGGYADPPTNLIPMFTDEISRLNFSKWKLRDLHLSPISLEQTLKLKCKLALVNALPNVESFCGLSPGEYMRN